ncbi:MAG: hypothetical protein IKN71_06960 [Alphaproteobacteria bacterium]|nr:hypothetical protein [Alphaproteobacteria bacterium]
MKKDVRKFWIVAIMTLDSIALLIVAYFLFNAETKEEMRPVILAYCGFALFLGACLMAILKKYPRDKEE